MRAESVGKRWKKLEPGVYSADDGELHLNIPELLVANGYPATTRNVLKAVTMATRLVREKYPTSHLVITTDPAPTIEARDGST